jgi:VIT1/CCC1 family predicted Fe2+/Mn2+ transporter
MALQRFSWLYPAVLRQKQEVRALQKAFLGSAWGTIAMGITALVGHLFGVKTG